MPLACQKQNNALKLNPSLSFPLSVVTMGAAGMSLASQRPQKHAVGSVNRVSWRMSQCYPTNKERRLQPNKIINNYAHNGTLAVFIQYIEVNRGKKKKSLSWAYLMSLPIIHAENYRNRNTCRAAWLIQQHRQSYKPILTHVRLYQCICWCITDIAVMKCHRYSMLRLI